MDSAFTHLSRWLIGRQKEPKTASSSSASVRSDSTHGIRNKAAASSSLASSSSARARTKRRHGNHDGGEIDKEFDVVLVQSDCAESEGVDWSIGWLEPHGPELRGEDDSENSFAVLVPCYGRRHINLEGGNEKSDKGDKQFEKWRSYFQKS